MNLIKCPNCNGENRDTEDTCIHCGYNLKNKDIKKCNKSFLNFFKRGYVGLFSSIILLFILGITLGRVREKGTFLFKFSEVIRISLIVWFAISIIQIIISFFKSINVNKLKNNKFARILGLIVIVIIIYEVIKPENSVERAVEVIRNKPYKVFKDAGMSTTDIKCYSTNKSYICNFSVYNDYYKIWVKYEYRVRLDGFSSNYELIENR